MEVNVSVKKKSKCYSVTVCDDFIKNINKYSQYFFGKKSLIITTPSVYKLYEKVINSIKNHFDQSEILVISSNEYNKNFNSVSIICNKANELNLGKNDIFISMCGGCCQDVITTAAALYKRGVRVLRIPTTLIGAVDAGVGIKSSLNIGEQKSTVGTFHHPHHVIVDLNFISTLPKNHILCGIAEIFKIGLILDYNLFNLLEKNYKVLVNSDYYKNISDENKTIIHKAIVGMISQLEQNFYEDITSERLMDFGHTFSNTIESDSMWSVAHGFAVSIDMALSSYISYKLNKMSFDELKKVLSLLKKFNLPLTSEYLTFDSCLRALKKVELHRGGKINLVIPVNIGKGMFLKKIDSELLSIIKSGIIYLKQNTKNVALIED